MKPALLLFSVLRHLSKAMALVAGFATFVLAFLIAFDVLARRLVGFSIQGTDELGGYVLAAVASLGFSYVLFEKGFTRIDILVQRLPRSVTDLLNVLAYVSLAFTAVFFAHRSVLAYQDTLLFSSRANSPLQTPMWIPQGVWVTGMVLFAICSVLYALRAIVLLKVDRAALDAEFGVTRIDDEVAEITEAALGANADKAREMSK